MGTLTIQVPRDIHYEYHVDNPVFIENLLDSLKIHKRKPDPAGEDKLLGLFSDQADLLDEITESAMRARENDPLRVT